MSAAIVKLPPSDEAAASAWDAYDAARMALERVYADPHSDRQERLARAQDCAVLWVRWRTLYLRSTS